jgi:hypothetical protein
MMAQGWDVISKCRTCGLAMQVNLDLIARSGAKTSPLGLGDLQIRGRVIPDRDATLDDAEALKASLLPWEKGLLITLHEADREAQKALSATGALRWVDRREFVDLLVKHESSLHPDFRRLTAP